ncbi:CmcJ/NvfI family oxidoreductase [Bradyrhizobium ivorense]|uniref:CmcJ/NvfI family oxidoreductase n=1 Tax=Bradyrhizobium ivorense TaxID=2511166 RepID=UPI001E5354D8|nr:CmcJ/NvfI family oxidoreductase [Bradyrhizobium ivorense]
MTLPTQREKTKATHADPQILRAAAPARADRDRLDIVKGEIAFTRRSPEERAREVPEAVLARYDAGLPQVLYDVDIRDARPIVNELSLDREGFILVPHKTSCADVRDPDVMRQKYLDEMVPFIKDYFNASWVVPRHKYVVMRLASATPPAEGGRISYKAVRGTAYNAHIDYAPVAAPMLAAQENQEQGIPIRVYSRLMIIQTWRALSPPPQDFPLAFADASTTPTTDVFEHTFINPVGESFRSLSVHYSPLVRWYYFPNMHPDEVVLFKGYDSDRHYDYWSAHSAFDNRRAYPNALPRESVEARFYVYFD